MKRLKKMACIILAISMLLTIAAGCSGNSTPAPENQPEGQKDAPKEAQTQDAPKKQVTLKFWGGVPAEYGPQQTIDKFNEEYKDKGIQAEYVRFVNDDTGNLKLETTLLAGGEIDLYMSYFLGQLVKRSEGNMALDITPYLQKAGFDPVAELGEGVKPYLLNGKYYSLPTKMENYYILANKNMFDKAGIPLPDSWSYDEFRDIAKKLTTGEGQNKTYGIFWNTAQEIFRAVYPVEAVLGPNFMYKAEGKATNFDNPEFTKAVKLVSDTMLVDKSAPTHVDNVTQKLTIEGMFLSQKAAMSIGVWSIRSIKDLQKYPHDFVTAYLPMPVSDKSAAKYSIGDSTIGDLLSINPKSKNIDAAFEFMMWYTKGGMLSMTPYGRVPLYKGIDRKLVTEEYMKDGEKILDRPSVEKFLEVKNDLAISTITTKLPEIQKVLNEEIEATLTGKKDAEKGMADAKKRSDEFLK